MRFIEIDLARGVMRHEEGFCWQIRLPPDVDLGDGVADGNCSSLEIFENGKTLGPAHTNHALIRAEGGGAFSHWGDTLYFSTSDNSDPVSSRRRFSIRAQQRPPMEEPRPKAAIAVRCPCCGSGDALKPYQTRLDYNGHQIKVEICTVCTALINRTSLEEALNHPDASLKEQEDGSRQVYTVDKTDDDIRLQLDAHRFIVQNLLNRAREPVPRGTAIDIGAGLGLLAASACDYFDNVWALEINRWTLEHMVKRLGLQSRLHVGTVLSEAEGPASVVMAWHSLEHIPELWKLGREVADKLEPGGAFYWQVPMYRDEYVVPTHYTFMNEYSSRVFAERIGLDLQDVWFDLDAQFITCVARKPA